MSSSKLYIQSFGKGLKDGIPICLGYFSVSFAFGIAVVEAGFPYWVAVLISATNLTSAGQLAGLTVMAAGGGLIEMAMTQLVINIRYALMSFSLTQKLSEKFRTPDRLAASFVITDEIFGVAISNPGKISRRYMLGLALTPFIGWVSGTLLGSVAGEVLPKLLVSSLGVAIYGMFIAIVVPEVKRFHKMFWIVGTAVLVSCILHYVPICSNLSEGFIIIISAVSASLLGAYLWPINVEQEGEEEEEYVRS